MFRILNFSLLVLLLASCKTDVVETYEPTPYVQSFPSYFPDMHYNEDNPMTEEGVALGRKLYYDKILHENEERACATCHEQGSSFTSQSSNALAHLNLGFASAFLWDGLIEGSMEDIMRFEVEDFFKTDVSRLQQHDEYPKLFYQAFGTSKITFKEIEYALAQFFRTLNSYNAKYDRKLQGLEGLTPQEWSGYDIFFTERGDCFHCHGGVLFTDNLFHNNALDANPGEGRFKVTNDPNDVGRYKTPTLRNIEFTAPYMHDGRFQTLEEVIDFYSEGLQDSPTVDPLMKHVGSGGIALTAQEKADLIAFLKTLSDHSYLTNPNLSKPQ